MNETVQHADDTLPDQTAQYAVGIFPDLSGTFDLFEEMAAVGWDWWTAGMGWPVIGDDPLPVLASPFDLEDGVFYWLRDMDGDTHVGRYSCSGLIEWDVIGYDQPLYLEEMAGWSVLAKIEPPAEPAAETDPSADALSRAMSAPQRAE